MAGCWAGQAKPGGREIVPYVLILLGGWLTRLMPLSAQRRMANLLAAMGWRFLPAMHDRVRRNVRQVLGPSASAAIVEQVARQQWRNYLGYLRDFVALPSGVDRSINEIFEAVSGWEHVDAAMAEGRGIVLVSAHFGNWDLAAAALARLYPVNVIADTFSPPRLDTLINRRRAALGLRVIPVERAVKRTVSALRRNEAVAFLVDKPIPGDQGVEVFLFGQKTRIPAGAAYFARRLGTPMIPAFVSRLPDGGFWAQVFPAVPVTRGEDAASDVQRAMQSVAHALEQAIGSRPESWYMFREMWPPRSIGQAAADRAADGLENEVGGDIEHLAFPEGGVRVEEAVA